MKFRHGFVSNSSSSSFVVIGKSDNLDVLSTDLNGVFTLSDKDTFCEFGWGPEVISNDIKARIMFAYLQTQDDQNGESWLQMLEKVIKEYSSIREIIWDVNKDENGKQTWNAYIDHQSSASEGSNTEIFDNEICLKDFIFSSDSKIVLDNDNH